MLFLLAFTPIILYLWAQSIVYYIEISIPMEEKIEKIINKHSTEVDEVTIIDKEPLIKDLRIFIDNEIGKALLEANNFKPKY